MDLKIKDFKDNIKKAELDKEVTININDHVCPQAALIGNLEYLKYAHENGYIWDEKTCINAAKSGK